MFDLGDILVCIRDVRFLFYCDRTKRYLSTPVIREGEIVEVRSRFAVGVTGNLDKPWLPYSMSVRKADKEVVQQVSPEHFDWFFANEENDVCRI